MTDHEVQASLRRLHSPDAWDLRSFLPTDPLNFGILTQAIIGSSEDGGEDSFDFMLCTPQWISAELQSEHVRWG
jgi:Immunity protein 8